LKIGLTGGIGCGKSTAVRIFEDAGFRTIESDAVVRGLLKADADVAARLRERWGETVFGADGAVDRKAVAARVFADAAELKWLESVLHPKVRASWTSAVAASPEAEWLVEIPLLFEKKLEREFDFTVCVFCPNAEVARRMRDRGYSDEEIERRRRRQLPLAEKIERADFVVSNAGSLEFLQQQCARLIERLRASA